MSIFFYLNENIEEKFNLLFPLVKLLHTYTDGKENFCVKKMIEKKQQQNALFSFINKDNF